MKVEKEVFTQNLLPIQEAAILSMDSRPDSTKPQEPQTGSIELTHLMRKVEKKFVPEGQPLREYIAKLYVEEKKSFRAIGNELEISEPTVSNWFRDLLPDLELRTTREYWQDPAHHEFHVSRIKNALQDPQRKASIIARIHTPEADAKRSLSMRNYHRQHPERFAEGVKKARQTKSETLKKRMTLLLGDNPKETLKSMVEVERLTAGAIAGKLKISSYTIRDWLRSFEIKAAPKRLGTNPEVLVQRRELLKRAAEADLLKYLTPRQLEVVNLLYPEGGQFITQSEAAKVLKCSKENIRQRNNAAIAEIKNMLAADVGVQHKGGRPRRELPVGLIKKLYEDEGLGLHEIALKFGYRYNTVRSRLIENNVKLRFRGRRMKHG